MTIPLVNKTPPNQPDLIALPKPENEAEQAVAPQADTTVEPIKTLPVTKLLDPEHVFRWGDFETGPEKKVMLRIAGHEDKPLSVAVDGAVIIGRIAAGDDQNRPQIDLNPYGALELGVSRHHIALLGRKWGIRVVDMQSKNGTYLNGSKLPAYEERILRDGDELRLGHLIIVVRFVE